MIHSIIGPNIFAAQQALAKLVDDFVATHGELAIERFSADEVQPDRLIDALQSMPFLATRKMVVVQEMSTNKVLVDMIEHIFESVAETTELIVYESTPDKRTSYYKLLKKHSVAQEFSNLDEQGLTEWLRHQAQEAGGLIYHADAHFLLQRVGTQQMLLFNEMQKLLTYDPQVTRQTIELLTEPMPQSKIFDLLDAALAGNHSRAMALYDDQRAQRVEPQYILAMMTWQLQNLAFIVFAGKRNQQQIADEAGLHPFVVRKTQTAAKGLTSQRLRSYIRELLTIDTLTKRSALNTDDALRQFILNL